MVEPKFELRSSDSKSSALCSTPCYLMQRIVSAVKDTRSGEINETCRSRAGLAEATKEGRKCVSSKEW